MTITTNEDSVIFTWSPTKSRTISKRNIKEITYHTQQLTSVVTVIVTLYSGIPLRFIYSSVTSPTSASAAALTALLQSYFRVEDGQQVFSAKASVLSYTVTNFTLKDGYRVYVRGMLTNYGHSRSGNVITFDDAFEGGEEIFVTNK